MVLPQQISLAILAKIIAGASLPEAYDAVIGHGAYRALVDNLYDELNAKG